MRCLAQSHNQEIKEYEIESKEIIRIKREQGEEKQEFITSIRSTDKVALEEFDLKTLIADEDAYGLRKLQSRLKTTRESMIVMMKKTMMMMKALQLDQTRVGQQREEDPNLSLLGQLSLLRKMITKVQRNHGSLMHLLPYNIQLLPQLDGRSLNTKRLTVVNVSNDYVSNTTSQFFTDTSLMHMLNLNPSLHKEDSLAADIMKALKESKKMSKRQPRTGGSNEGTGNILGVPDESTVISRALVKDRGSSQGFLMRKS
ncbi:hypothetical protein Tco_0411391 [Tanacetum coccineum]